MQRTLPLLLAALALIACENKDTTAPPAPVVDPIDSPTPKAKISVTGSAEYGATVRIAGGASAVETKADVFTARWRATVELTPDATNALSVTATDAAGNTSEATTVEVVQAPSRPASVKLAFTAAAARAGELVGLVTRVLDQYGNELPDAAVTFTATPALAASFTIPGSNPAVTKDQGVLAGTRQFVAYELSAVKAAGYQFSIKAVAGTAETTEVLVVRPAAAASFSRLAFKPSGTALTVQAGQDAEYDYEVVDLYGNVTQGPISAYTNAPGAIVLEDGVSGAGKVTRLTTAGTYSLLFYIAGAGQRGTLSLTVGTAPGAFVDVSASATLASPTSAVKVFARVRDAFGNPILCAAGNTGDVTFAATGAGGGSATPSAVTCFNGAFQASFIFGAEDTFSVTATYQPTGATAVAGTVFITVLAFDNTPPQVSIQNVRVNGAPCNPAARTPAGCDVVDGDAVEFDLVASDNTALAELAYSAFFESTQTLRTRAIFVAASSASQTVAIRFTVRSNATETALLVGSAVDRAGNRQNTAALSLFCQFGGLPVGARVVSLVASGPLINRPNDAAFAANGDLFIVARGSGNIVRLPQGSTTPAIFATGFAGEFIAHAGSGAGERFFVSDRNSGSVSAFSPAGGGMSLLADPNGNQARGLSVLGALAARGWANVELCAQADQVRVTLGATTEVYEFDSLGTCVPTGKVCVTVAAGATGAQKATALAAAITGNASSAVAATASASLVLLAAKTAGEAGTAIALAKAPAGSLITLSAATLLEGHDADLYVANDGDNLVRRYLTTGGPYLGTTNHGQFNVGTVQWGLAVRDVWASPSNLLQNLMLYQVGGGGQNTLTGAEVRTASTGGVVTTTTAQRFAVTSTTVAPIVGFGALWDLALAPNGCLLASDDGSGNVYAVDVRAGLTFPPASVERIGRNFFAPRGLTVAPNGDLIIADDGANAVYRLTPTADPNDCF